MRYTHSLPTSTSFNGEGLFGYTFGPLQQKDLEIYYIEVQKGHDTFMISKRITRAYYVLCGSGYFTIGDRRYDVRPGMLVEVPPKVEYSYSGKMTMVAVCKPRWFSGNDVHTKWNPDVVQGDLPLPANAGSGKILSKLRRESPVNLYIRLNKWLWKRLPSKLRNTRPVVWYGTVLHRLVCRRADRTQYTGTFFFRNRPQLELMRRLAGQKAPGSTLNIGVLGCSIGAEIYSILSAIRTTRPDLNVRVCAVDNSAEVLKIAKEAVYTSQISDFVGSSIFERMTEAEFGEIFEGDQREARVRSWMREGISWHLNDVRDPELIRVIGPQDMVVASNFLCHMEPLEAENCLRNIAGTVRREGYLFVTGVSVDIREKVARDLHWQPVSELIREIHDGDQSVRQDWPFAWWGLEPLDTKIDDWQMRYAAVFQLNSSD
jgi:chemotaxis methyl-accepting protein methylase/mannose-6-phosphate isomerase-like protein (cupin superfamily)